MLTTSPSFRGALRTGLKGFRAGLFQILPFEILYRTLIALAVRPFMAFLIRLLMGLEGYGTAFNEGIWRFALTAPGVIAIALLALIAVLSVFFEYAVVISIARQAIMGGGEEGLKASFVRGLWCLGSLKGWDTLLFAVYALFLLPLVNMGVTSSLRTPLMLLIWLAAALLQLALMPLLLTLLTAYYLPFAQVSEPEDAAREKIQHFPKRITHHPRQKWLYAALRNLAIHQGLLRFRALPNATFARR